ncbi:TetR/AcrR family transcriptional regulator [Arthrobacter sp. B0490]|uniref:TetR/AcrR family transcriptional regulator n=1 Tax=Arthrobacter sp. B0490 TaxID=2058891 RepID=UPI0015E2EADF|nr:TetR/AcrR family transcriptional regulator [Arthrobacter sp. B0490]
MPKISAATIAEHKLHTWGLLLDAVDALILERPFEAISMRDVAQRSGVARTAIYNYAPDTVTLLIEAAKRGSAQVDEAVARRADNTSLSPAERLHEIVVVLLTEHAQSTRAFIAMQTIERTLQQDRVTDAVIPFRDQIGNRINDVVRAGVEAGEFAPVEDPALTRALMVGVMQAALRVLSGAHVIGKADAEIVSRFLINALSRSPESLP